MVIKSTPQAGFEAHFNVPSVFKTVSCTSGAPRIIRGPQALRKAVLYHL